MRTLSYIYNDDEGDAQKQQDQHTYIHTFIHTYTHTYMHIHTYSDDEGDAQDQQFVQAIEGFKVMSMSSS